jgi:DnaJ family protein B protein 11
LVSVEKEGTTQPGDIIKVRGEGMPLHQSSERGDLYVKIDVIFPYDLSEKQKESKFFLIF